MSRNWLICHVQSTALTYAKLIYTLIISMVDLINQYLIKLDIIIRYSPVIKIQCYEIFPERRERRGQEYLTVNSLIDKWI